jgi:hypothetical protein
MSNSKKYNNSSHHVKRQSNSYLGIPLTLTEREIKKPTSADVGFSKLVNYLG